MATFDELIKEVHENGSLRDDIKEDKNIILINEKRQFIPGESFDNIIAYEGDINSQIITFKCPRYQDKHDLCQCMYRELKWKNNTSGNEGTSVLKKSTTPVDETSEYFYLRWEVPPEVCTHAGILEISICIQDLSTTTGGVLYSWNTSKYSGLTIGSSLESVGFNPLPAKDEILMINRDTKAIVAPVGYNNTICNYGDVDTTEIYFLINQYLGKKKEINVMESKVTIYVTMNGFAGKDDRAMDITKNYYVANTEDLRNTDLILIAWRVPVGITAGPGGPGPLKVMLCFEHEGKKWYSNTYSNLTVGENLFNGEVERPSDWDMFEDFVSEAVLDYFGNNNFIFDAN